MEVYIRQGVEIDKIIIFHKSFKYQSGYLCSNTVVCIDFHFGSSKQMNRCEVVICRFYIIRCYTQKCNFLLSCKMSIECVILDLSNIAYVKFYHICDIV